MVAAGPRLDKRLIRVLVAADDGTVPIAEVCRRVGAAAEADGLTRPSYECVRTLVHLARELRATRRSERLAEIRRAWARSGYWIAFDHVLEAILELR